MSFCVPKTASMTSWIGYLTHKPQPSWAWDSNSFWSPLTCWFVLLWVIDRVLDSPYCLCVTYQRLPGLGRPTRKHPICRLRQLSQGKCTPLSITQGMLWAWLLPSPFIFLFVAIQNVTESSDAEQDRQYSLYRLLWFLCQMIAISL